MDRRLFIKGRTLIETWEDLTTQHIFNWMNIFFPVAFKEDERGAFGAYPTEIYCTGRIIQLDQTPIAQALDQEYTFRIGWDTAIDHDSPAGSPINDLYFSVISADKYLTSKGFKTNDRENINWQSRLQQATQAALSLNNEFISCRKLAVDSKIFHMWFSFVNDLQVRPTVRLSIEILLKSLSGTSNAELKTEFSRASISRYKSSAKRFITKNAHKFSHLPKLPL